MPQGLLTYNTPEFSDQLLGLLGRLYRTGKGRAKELIQEAYEAPQELPVSPGLMERLHHEAGLLSGPLPPLTGSPDGAYLDQAIDLVAPIGAVKIVRGLPVLEREAGDFGIDEVVPRLENNNAPLGFQLKPQGGGLSASEGLLPRDVTPDTSGLLGPQITPNVGLLPLPKGLTPNQQIGDLGVERIQRQNLFGETFSEEGKKYHNWVKRNQNKSAIHSNAKTGMSIDFSTTCPKKACKSGACAYCYVEQPRTQKKLGIPQVMSPKKEGAENAYRHELQAMPEEVVTELNRDGGLRMFSFGDYRPAVDYDNVANVLTDAQQKGLYIKAITKEPELIRQFGDHPNFRANISVDAMPRELSNAPTVDEAIQWKAGRENVKIRAVALNEQQAMEFAADPRIDVVTLYHGPTGEKLAKIVKEQNPELLKRGEQELVDELSTWQNMPPRSKVAKALQEKYPGRFCCLGGKCSKDNNKCGFGLGAVLTGVMIQDWMPGAEGEPTL